MAFAVGAWVAWRLAQQSLSAVALPRWDMAWNGWLGLELAEDVRTGRLLDLLLHLYRHDVWPFATSLLMAPLFLFFGPGFWPPLLLGIGLYGATLVLLVVVARQVEPASAGSAAGLLAAALLLGAPELRLLSIVVMREIPGLFFTLAALALYLRARRLGSLGSYRLAGLGALTLVFVKANYGLVFLAAALLDDLGRRTAPDRRAILAKAIAWLWPRGTGSSGRWLLAGALWSLATLYLAGVGIGNGAYALLVILTIVWTRSAWPRRQTLFARLAAMPPARRATLETLVAPLFLWCSSPRHLKGLLGFLRNRSSDLSLSEGALFYPRALLNDYVLEPAIGWAVLASAAVGLVIAWRRGGAARTLALLALVQLLSLSHPYKLSRFAATAAPQLFLLAGLAVVWLGLAAIERSHDGAISRVAVGGLWLAGLGALLGTASLVPAAERGLAEQRASWSSPPQLGPVLETLAEASIGAPRVALLGGFDELSPWLVSWRLVQSEDTRETRVVKALRRFSADRPSAEVVERVAAWLDEQNAARLLAIRLDGASSFAARDDFQTVNAWQQRAIDVLDELDGWQRARNVRFPDLALEVEIWNRRSDRPIVLRRTTLVELR